MVNGSQSTNCSLGSSCLCWWVGNRVLITVFFAKLLLLVINIKYYHLLKKLQYVMYIVYILKIPALRAMNPDTMSLQHIHSPLPLFFVDLEPTDHSNEIFKLSNFLHTKIKIEEPYKPKVRSQCLNCQDYGHTRAYCGYPSRCVRCSAFHPSTECTKTRETAAKCALCSGDHPANYRGCSVYKEL